MRKFYFILNWHVRPSKRFHAFFLDMKKLFVAIHEPYIQKITHLPSLYSWLILSFEFVASNKKKINELMEKQIPPIFLYVYPYFRYIHNSLHINPQYYNKGEYIMWSFTTPIWSSMWNVFVDLNFELKIQ